LGLFAKCSLFSKLPIIEELALGLRPNSPLHHTDPATPLARQYASSYAGPVHVSICDPIPVRVACLIFLYTPTTLEASLVQVVRPTSAQTASRSLHYARQPIFLQAFQLGFHLCSMNPTHAWSAARVPRATSLLISTYQPNNVHHTNTNLYISQPGAPLSLWFVPACLTKE